MLVLLTACVITNKDVEDRLDADGDGYVSWEYGGDDCDDDDATQNPGVPERCDNDEDDDCDDVIGDPTDADGDGVSVCELDCDDEDPDRAPGATEACDGIDNDCDDIVDEGLPEETFYSDDDGDGYGDPDSPPVFACFPPEGYVADDGDCDDTDHTLNPETTWYRDIDGDGSGDATSPQQACEQPDIAGVLYVRSSGDCDDTDGEAYPGRPEVGTALACNGVDNDCDPSTAPDELIDHDGDGSPWCADCDDDDPNVFPDLIWYADLDGDGFGAGSQNQGCPGAVGFATVDGDCDDHDIHLNPTTPWYLDADEDDIGDAAHAVASCLDPSGGGDTYVRESGDCDDTDATAYPGHDDLGARACNGVDNDCDPLTAPDELTDFDMDGSLACEDCDDTDHRFPSLDWYLDGDGDGVGAGAVQGGCPADDLWSEQTGDCDDDAPLVSSTAFTVDAADDLGAILAAVCPATVITVADGVTYTQDLTFGRDVTLQAAGTATLVGDHTLTADVELIGVDIEGDVTTTDAALVWSGGAHDGSFETSGGELVLSDVDLTLTTTGSVFDTTRLEWTDVFVDAGVTGQTDALDVIDAPAHTSLLRVHLQGPDMPMTGRVGLLLQTQDATGTTPVSLKNVLVTGMAVGIEVREQAADLQFVTVADYFSQGLLLRGNQAVDVRDSLFGRPRGYGGDPPDDYYAIRVDGPVPVSFDATFSFVADDTQDTNGATVTDTTGAFTACENTFFPGPPAGGDGPPRCEQVLDRPDDVEADLSVTPPMAQQTPMDFLFGRITDFDGDCHGLTPPGPGNTSPDDCFQPGYFGGSEAPEP